MPFPFNYPSQRVRSWGRFCQFLCACQIRRKFRTANRTLFHFLELPLQWPLQSALSHWSNPWTVCSTCFLYGRGLGRFWNVLVPSPLTQSRHEVAVLNSSSNRTRNPNRCKCIPSPTPLVGAWNLAVGCDPSTNMINRLGPNKRRIKFPNNALSRSSWSQLRFSNGFCERTHLHPT